MLYNGVELIKFQGVKYSGIKISHKSNIGRSQEDKYITGYHVQTYQK